MNQQLTKSHYINATKLCRRHGRHFGNFRKLPRFRELLAVYGQNLGIHPDDLIDMPRGRKGAVWVHRRIALQVAQWASVDFSVVMCRVACDIVYGRDVACREAIEIAYIRAGLAELLDGHEVSRPWQQQFDFESIDICEGSLL